MSENNSHALHTDQLKALLNVSEYEKKILKQESVDLREILRKEREESSQIMLELQIRNAQLEANAAGCKIFILR